MLIDEKRGAEEAYCSATTTSDMRVVMDSDRMGDAETIIAAGMSKYYAGACFIRLHSEWSRAERPRILGKEEAARLISALPRPKGERPKTPAQLLLDHYRREAGFMFGKLKSYRAAHGYLATHLADEGSSAAQAAEKATAVLFWWLSPTCHACGGTKWQVVEGTNRHGNRQCKSCRGTGLAHLPHGEIGRKAANYIDDCTQGARDSIRRRLKRN